MTERNRERERERERDDRKESKKSDVHYSLDRTMFIGELRVEVQQ